MSESSGRYWTSFNGEIYNYAELAALLRRPERPLRSGTDTEVILNAFAEWGMEAFKRLRGMYALAIYDAHSRRMFLARDPLGIKPLYYWTDGQTVLFASEIRALCSSGMFDRRVSQNAIDSFLTTGAVAGPDTIVEGVRLLEPGAIATIELTGSGARHSIAYPFRQPDQIEDPIVPEKDRAEAIAHLRHLLKESVKAHLVSDVPVGLFLSGGIDSTALLALMTECSSSVVRTFTVCFEEADMSERHIATEVAREANVEFNEVLLTERLLLDQLPRALSALDQPTIDGVNTFVVASAVHQAGIKVALSGLGGDELFGGYPSFARMVAMRKARAVPRPIRAMASKAGAAILGKGQRNQKIWELLASDGSAASVYRVSRQLFSGVEAGKLTGRAVTAPVAPVSLAHDELNMISSAEIRGYMSNTLLRDTDVMSMASSLEVRVPFVDRVVMRYVLGLPGAWKWSMRRPKPLLLEALGTDIPPLVWRRRKMGFSLPFDRWLRNQMRGDVVETLNDSRALSRVGLDKTESSNVWTGFENRRLRWAKPWSIFALTRWATTNRMST